MENKIKLAVVEQHSTGGLIHYAYQLCTVLAERALDVVLITGTDYELRDFPHNFEVENRLRLWKLIDPSPMGEPPKGFIRHHWRRLAWNLRRVIRAWRLIREWFRLTGYLIKSRPDIVQFGKINFPFEGFFLAWMRKRGLVLTQICHEFERRESDSWISRVIDRTYNSIYLNFSHIFFHAEENRDRFLELFDYDEANTSIIPHGNESIFLKAAEKLGHDQAELRESYGLKREDSIALFFGAISPSKGIPDLLDAFAIVRNLSPVKLLVAGYPTKYVNVEEYQQQVTDLDIADRVIFDFRYIPIADVGALFKMASVVVYPYLSSTQSGSLQVAFSFGRPVVATHVGGLPEAVEDGKNGFLVPPGDNQALAEKIAQLANSPELSRQMGSYAHQLSISKFGWGPIAEQIEAQYLQLRSNHG